eukprot:Skav213937  [mRNA]  locus=scaffold2679:290194:290442:- [translate_table: standard]
MEPATESRHHFGGAALAACSRRTLAELHRAEGPLGHKAVVYCAHAPQQSAAYTGPEALEATAEVIRRAVGPSGPNDQQLGML